MKKVEQNSLPLRNARTMLKHYFALHAAPLHTETEAQFSMRYDFNDFSLIAFSNPAPNRVAPRWDFSACV